MNNRIKRLYIATSENKVIFVSTGLSDFVRSISALVTGIRSYSYYNQKFKNQTTIKHVDRIGKVYYFHKYNK